MRKLCPSCARQSRFVDAVAELATEDQPMPLIDLSHDFTDGMPGFSLRRDGEVRQFTASVRPFVTHEQSAPYYNGEANFEITEITFQTSMGTYLDAPYHRWKERRDISKLRLEETILPGLRVDVADA
jgi:arylformamidase